MLEWILCVLYVGFALCATAACWSALTRLPSVAVRRALVALVGLALLVPTLDFAWMGISMRFGVGIGQAPWMLGGALLLSHVAGLLVLRHHAGGAAGWPLATLCTAAGVALALDATVLWNLDLRARLRVSELRFEAGRTAYALRTEPRDEPGNAAPTYMSVGLELFGGEDMVVLQPWASLLAAGEPFDPVDPDLVIALERCAPRLDEVRAASRLPRCDFVGGPLELVSGDADTPWNDNHVLYLLSLSHALALNGSTCVTRGDLSGALEDIEALLAISDQTMQTPLFLHLIVAGLQRSLACEVLAQWLSAPGLQAELIDRLGAALPGALMARASDALLMEQAWGLSVLGRFTEEQFGAVGVLEVPGYGPLQRAFYRVFFLDHEVVGYRAAMTEQVALASASLGDLEVESRRSETEGRERAARRGLMTLLGTGNFALHLIGVQRADALVGLARVALDASSARLEHGAYPQTMAELGVEGVKLELDASGLTLTDTDPAWGDDPPSLRIGTQR